MGKGKDRQRRHRRALDRRAAGLLQDLQERRAAVVATKSDQALVEREAYNQSDDDTEEEG
jgi:hypothetical protein